jgi:nucleotide-binding universal stress UspA family protein
MSGIIVGVDGSGHSQHALVFAMHEAAIRHVPLTALTVHEAVRGYYGAMAVYADDPVRTEDARAAAQAETDKVLAGLDEPRPESVTSRRFMASSSRSSSTRPKTPTCSSWARAVRAVSPG